MKRFNTQRVFPLSASFCGLDLVTRALCTCCHRLSLVSIAWHYVRVWWHAAANSQWTLFAWQPHHSVHSLDSAAWVDTHSHDMVDYILQELWDTYGFPEEYKPSHEQFTNLVKTSEGLLAGTTFGETIEGLTGSYRLEARASREDDSQSRNWERCADAKDVAKVLHALFEISKGKIQSVEVTGDMECAWVAGVADWLFCFTVHVDGVTEDMPFRGSAQVNIKYNLEHQPNYSQSSVARIERTTFYLENSDFFWSQLSSNESVSLLILRVPWENCLSRSFGTHFHELCKADNSLAEYLGSAARIYTAFAHGEPDVGSFESSRANFIDISDGSHGSGLVHSITSIFPELNQINHFVTLMQLAEGRTFSQAVQAFQSSYQSIKLSCKCRRCSIKYLPSHASAKTCIPVIAHTILHVARRLGSIERDHKLLPTISGIRHIHRTAPRESDYVSEVTEGGTQHDEDKSSFFGMYEGGSRLYT